MPGPDRPLRRALDTVRRAVRTAKLWSPGARMLLGCSGGLDSMVALELLVQLRPSLRHGLAIAHVDHGLWPGSVAAVSLVRTAAERHGLAFASVRLDLAAGAQLEARARDARYAALQAMGRDLACDGVVTAHNADDQAETLLLRLARGSGLDALAGIRRRRDDGDGLLPVVRPLLGLDRPRLRACADSLGLAWHEDPSNANIAFTRNDIRHNVLPALEAAVPGAASGLARTAEHLAAHEGVLDAWIGRALAGDLQIGPEGALLAAAAVPDDPDQIAALLRHVCRRLGAPPPSTRAVAQACAVLSGVGHVPPAPGMSTRIKGLDLSRGPLGWHFRSIVVAQTGGAD